MPQKLHLHCDESCQNAHRYLVIGSIVVEEPELESVSTTIEQVKTKPRAAKGELKWQKLSPYGLPTYKDLVDQFAALRAAGKINYHCIVVDTHKVDHKKYHDGDKELGFSKFIYQILLKHCRIYHPDTDFYCYLDERSTVHTPDSLRIVLNNGANKKYGRRPYKVAEFRDSKTCILIQTCDVLTGAIAYRKNEKDITLPPSVKKESRNELSDYVRRKMGLPNLKDCTPMRLLDFTIWNIKLD